ncbi:MAG: EamA family transporter [Nitrospirota bacterium]|nr:EamA family transporter [Nitrospirota bacterium]
MSPLHLFLLLVCVAALAAGQILFKLSARHLSASGQGMISLLLYPGFLLALVLYGGATLLWIWLLRNIPLTLAYPFFALTFLFVPLASWAFLGEVVGARYWVGVGLILLGIWVTTSQVS